VADALRSGNCTLITDAMVYKVLVDPDSGKATGVPAGHEVTVALSNTAAQYWATPDAAGNYTIAGVQAGTYTETLYDGELEVGRKTVTIGAGATTAANIVDSFYIPSNPIFRIGTWDGTPVGFLNSDKIEIMHPSDVRMSPWTSTPNFVVGTNTDAQWPMVQFMGVNNSQRITFNLTSAQVQKPEEFMSRIVRLTLAYDGTRFTLHVGRCVSGTSFRGCRTTRSSMSSNGDAFRSSPASETTAAGRSCASLRGPRPWLRRLSRTA